MQNNIVYFAIQSTFMDDQHQSLADLKHIKNMMERSSRFVSLSGLSGVGAGICALIGAYLAYPYVLGGKEILIDSKVGIVQAMNNDYGIIFNNWLLWIAASTFIAAFFTAFLFSKYVYLFYFKEIWFSILIFILFCIY